MNYDPFKEKTRAEKIGEACAAVIVDSTLLALKWVSRGFLLAGGFHLWQSIF